MPKQKIDILKLDIEGSELRFLLSLFALEVYPAQILLEIDELHFPSFKNKKIATTILKMMSQEGYELIYRDVYNFTYLRTG